MDHATRWQHRWPFVQPAFMDSGYAGDHVEIVRQPKDKAGFAGHPRRWLVERFFTWIGRNRHLTKNFDATIASIIFLLRRIASSA